MADATCGALDPSGIYHCTKPAGHVPTNQHRSDFWVPDPANPPYATPGFFEWTTTP